jgi:hypothetical protein
MRLSSTISKQDSELSSPSFFYLPIKGIST